MLETFYHTFGFFGALFLAFFAFAAFIFWVAGIAGIAYLPESRAKTIQLIISALFPPYAFCWLFYDIFQERKLMEK